jgi:tripeptide aminopeptidase
LLDLFLELCAIPSPEGQERRVTDRVIAELDALGLDWLEDDTGPSYGAEAGNLLARMPATVDGGTPVFLCAHVDTVAVEGLIEPIVDDGFVRTAGETILGADNKSAVVVMLEAARRIVAGNVPHAGLELLFTQREETGLRGAEAFDLGRLEARLGYVYDQAAPIGEVVMGAPSACSIEARFHGRASHAGMNAEDGRSAILAAARAIADLRLGQLDERTTANVGVIEGGTARNIVPEWCSVRAEARSRDEATLTALVQEMVDALAFAAATSDCTVETKVARMYPGYELRGHDPVVRLAEDGLRRAGVEPTRVFSGGGADGNVFNAKGVPCVNLANGMVDIHTHDERIAIADLERMVDVTFGILAAARETPP